MFDGQKRYDLKLAFRRMDKAKADKGYQGPALVCAVTLQPIAGHRPASSTVTFLAGGRDIELWLAPVAGTRMTESLMTPEMLAKLDPSFVSPMVAYLCSEQCQRTGEIWSAGTRLLAPIRVQVANMLGNIVVQAVEFQATAQSPARAAIVPQ